MEQALAILKVILKAKVQKRKSLPAINAVIEKRNSKDMNYIATLTKALPVFFMNI